MSNLVVYKKPLKTSSNCVGSLLKSLNSLFGCVYLKQQESPIIGVLPSYYILSQDDTLNYYQRCEIQKYHHISKFTQLNEHLNFKQNHNKNHPNSFNGGYIGFIDFDYAAARQVSNTLSPQPNLYFGCYLNYLKLEEDIWYFYSHEIDADVHFEFLQSHLDQQQNSDCNTQLDPLYHSQNKQQPFQLTKTCQAQWSKPQYQRAFTQIQDYIRAGDCYQINLTQKFSGQAQGELIDVADAMWKLTNAPYSGYLKLNDFELLSCSPELFIEFGSQRQLITKPIKGTMPRFSDTLQDERSKQSLIDSEKDQAENLMIVDLLRNDFSVYAETGSVKTTKLFEIESFNQVHHMVSEVQATLKANIHPVDVLLSSLPGGSITGAPKIRAMQIIEELESGPRGAYCGSMGYFNLDGTGCWNILIRTIQKYKQEVNIWAGGGITIASDCDAEYQECLDKVSAMLDLLNTWQTTKPECPDLSQVM